MDSEVTDEEKTCEITDEDILSAVKSSEIAGFFEPDRGVSLRKKWKLDAEIVGFWQLMGLFAKLAEVVGDDLDNGVVYVCKDKPGARIRAFTVAAPTHATRVELWPTLDLTIEQKFYQFVRLEIQSGPYNGRYEFAWLVHDKYLWWWGWKRPFGEHWGCHYNEGLYDQNGRPL